MLQKQLDDMEAQLELAKANPGDGVQITLLSKHSCPPEGMLQTAFF